MSFEGEHAPKDSALAQGSWLVLLLGIYLLLTLLYHVWLRPFWVESFGSSRIYLCDGQHWVTVPHTVPRAFTQDELWKQRAALVVSPDWELHIHVNGEGRVAFQAPDKYYLWVPPDYQRERSYVNIQADGCLQRLALDVEPRSEYAAKRLLGLLFGIPLVSAITIVITGSKLYLDQKAKEEERKEKRRKEEEKRQKAKEVQRQRREALLQALETTPLEQVGVRYLALWQQEVPKPGPQQPTSESRQYITSPEDSQEAQQQLQQWWQDFIARLEPYQRWAVMRPVYLQILQEWQNVGQFPLPTEPLDETLSPFGETWESQITKPSEGTISPSAFAEQWAVFFLAKVGVVEPLAFLAAKAIQYIAEEEKEENAVTLAKVAQRIFQIWQESHPLAGTVLAWRVKERLEQDEQEIEKPVATPSIPMPQQARGPLALWPERLPKNAFLALIIKGEARKVPNPFGPEKGEKDPRLPTPLGEGEVNAGLFWPGHPAWNALQRDEHTLYLAPPGSGTSTFIWMGRHQYRYWSNWGGGENPPALSLYLYLAGQPSPQRLQALAERALAHSIAFNLVEDPLWFLEATSHEQHLVASWLYRIYRTEENIWHLLKSGGIDQNHRNTSLVFMVRERLAHWSNSPFPADLRETLQALSEMMGRYGTRSNMASAPVACRIFVELTSEPPSSLHEWLQTLLTCEDIWSMGSVKVFVPSEIPPSEMQREVRSAATWLPTEEITWSKKQLQALIHHRLEYALQWPYARLLPYLATRLGAKKEHAQSLETLAQWIVQQVAKQEKYLTPQHLIVWGNRRWQASEGQAS